ncbi:hypothetical protein [Streptomyces sp. NPDC046988]
MHRIGSALALGLLTAVADIAARSGAALTSPTVLTLIVPARAARNERTL